MNNGFKTVRNSGGNSVTVSEGFYEERQKIHYAQHVDDEGCLFDWDQLDFEEALYEEVIDKLIAQAEACL